MKLVKLSSLFIMAITLLSFKANNCTTANAIIKVNGTYSSVKWKTDIIDLGEVKQNKPVTIEFEFTNTSDAAVILTEARASCGCTVTDFPKQPIAAGKSSKIVATFNAPTLGAVVKTVTVSFQNEEPKVLSFKGTVI